MRRRKFIKHMGHVLAVPPFLSFMGTHPFRPFWQSSTEDRILVIIYLDGGNDGLNSVIPLDRLSELNVLRPNITIKDKDMIMLSDLNYALHPELKGLSEMCEQGKLSIIQNVGYPNPDFSHFRSNDIWMSGSGSDRHIASGWIGRYLNEKYPGYPENYPNSQMDDPIAAELSYENSLLLQGTPGNSMSVVIGDIEAFYDQLDLVDDEFEALHTDKPHFIDMSYNLSKVYGNVIKKSVMKAGKQLDYPNTELAQKLKTVAGLISGGSRTRVYFASLSGFDTHGNQVVGGNTSIGRHAVLLKELDGAVSTFVKDLDNLGVGDRVIGMTYSEMGRRIRSNASNGTDHGAAAPMFVFGNKVKGGVTGSSPYLDEHMGIEDNLEMEFDYRQVYASVLAGWFGAEKKQINSILFGEYETLPIL